MDFDEVTDGGGIILDTASNGSTPNLETFPVLKGTSGREYRGVNLLTELGTRQKNAARDCIAPVLPSVLATLLKIQQGLDGDKLTDAAYWQTQMVDLIREIDLEAVFNAMVYHDLDLRLLAVLFLPVDNRRFNAEDVDARMEDLMDISYAEKYGAFKSFFTSNGNFSPTTSRSFMQSMMTPKTQTPTNPGSTLNPGITSS